METTFHYVNTKDYKGLSREDICNKIKENRRQHQKYLSEKWNLQGKEREAHEKKIHELDIEEMKLQLALEEMDYGRM